MEQVKMAIVSFGKMVCEGFFAILQKLKDMVPEGFPAFPSIPSFVSIPSIQTITSGIENETLTGSSIKDAVSKLYPPIPNVRIASIIPDQMTPNVSATQLDLPNVSGIVLASHCLGQLSSVTSILEGVGVQAPTIPITVPI